MTPLTLLRTLGVDASLKDDGVLLRARVGAASDAAELYAYAHASELIAELRVEATHPDLFRALVDADRLRLVALGFDLVGPLKTLKKAASAVDDRIAAAAIEAGLPIPPRGDPMAARAAVMTAILLRRVQRPEPASCARK